MSFLLSLVFFHFIGSISTSTEVCNPMKCFSIIDTFLTPCPSKEQCNCEKVTELERCVRECLPYETDNFVLKGLQEVKYEICDNFQEFEIGNKCQNNHKFRLFSCIYEKFQLEAEDPNANNSLLMCRQAFDGQFCEQDSLTMCNAPDSYLAQVLLVKFFKPLEEKSCGSFSVIDVNNLNLKTLVYMKDYNNLADCLDANSPRITDCVPKEWISTNVQDKSMMCSAMESFLHCVEKVVNSSCRKQIRGVFTSIREPLLLYLLPYCFKQQSSTWSLESPTVFDNSYSLNETFFDETVTNASEVVVVSQHVVTVNDRSKNATNNTKITEAVVTVPPQNASEVIVVYQHDVIIVKYPKNAANQLCICCYIVMAILFIICQAVY